MFDHATEIYKRNHYTYVIIIYTFIPGKKVSKSHM